jgi:hypothetical protein
MSDYIPTPDPEFNNWVTNYADYVNTNFAALGLTVAQNTALQNDYTTWSTDYPAALTGQTTSASLIQTKDTTRVSLEDLVRQYTASMQANPNVNDHMKAALDITIPKTTKTPSPVPTTRPMANVDNRNRLQHVIDFFDETTPNSRAKPFGVRGAEIWLKIGGTPPTGPNEVTYLATDTKTPYTNNFEDTDANKTVHYMLRWVNTRNEPGPWSETISVTISG